MHERQPTRPTPVSRVSATPVIAPPICRPAVWRYALLSIILAVCTAACTRQVDILGEAMSPTLRNGQTITTTPALDPLQRGDIVGFRYPHDESKSFVQRIVGLPGERIEMSDGYVAIDGQPLQEDYVVDENRSSESWGPIAIPDDEYFVMGDNRRNSSDSRTWGTVRRNLIWARVRNP